MTQELRVLHVVECFGGGLLKMVSLVTDTAAGAGAAQRVAYGRRSETPAQPELEFNPHVQLIDLDWRRRSPRSQLGVALRLRQICDDWRPDVIHLHSSFAGAVGAFALSGRAPMIYTPHAFPSTVTAKRSQRAAFRAVERFIVNRADVVGAVSQSEAELALELGARRVTCIPNGIPELDPERLAPDSQRWPTGANGRVVAAGRLTPQRRPTACAQILAGVADLAEVAWIGGGGVNGRKRSAAMAALTAAGARPTGWLGREAVLEELRRASVYLHWTAGDGQALSLLEAMACDTVIVASDIPANRDVVDRRQLCATEAEAIAMIRRIVTEPAYAEELLARQRRRRHSHSASAMGQAWLELYRRLTQTDVELAAPQRLRELAV